MSIDALLAPGMGMLRRLRMSGKFGIVTAVLMLPIAIGGITGIQNSGLEADTTARRIVGLQHVQALTTLDTDLALAQLRLLSGEGTAYRPPAGVKQLQLLDADERDVLDLHDQYTNLMLQLERLNEPSTSTAQAFTRYDAASKAVVTYLRAATVQSGLTVDGQTDTHLAASVVGERLVQMIGTAVNLGDALTEPGSTQTRLRLLDELAADHERIQADLNALSATTSRLDLEKAASGYLPVNDLLRTLTQRAGQASTGPEAQGAIASIPPLVKALQASADSLSDSLNEALRAQQLRQNQQLLIWLFAVLMPLAGAGYLSIALIRSTTADVGAVLAAINGVTREPMNNLEPLSGTDEFAEMSRAVLLTSDRLTSLMGELRYSATHDELTGLANRRSFTTRLSGVLADHKERTAVVLLDLDGFQNINDSFGHDLGDRLLRVVGARFQHASRTNDLVGRFSADEFAVLLPGVHDHGEAEHLAQQLRESLHEPVELDGRPLRMQVSIGIALDDGDEGAVDLIRNADVALYLAKNAGKNQLVVFEPAMHSQALERTVLSVDLAAAVAAGDLHLVYQPIVDMVTGRMKGMEALVRWNHPTRGFIPPDVFIPLAETSGLIVEIGRFVLAEACRATAQWHRDFPQMAHISVDVNVSPAQLSSVGLVDDVVAIMRETGIDPSLVILEVTESAVIGDADGAIERLHRLAATGVRIALDDFGTGYSSLSHLNRMPIQVLKIDKSFIRGLDVDGRSEAMARCILDLADSLGLQCVAEGIEYPGEASVLKSLGCAMAQGYLYARPLNPQDMTDRLREESITLAASRRSPVSTGAPAVSGLPSPQPAAQEPVDPIAASSKV